MHIFILSNLILQLIILYIKVVVFSALFRSYWTLRIFVEFVCIVKILRLSINPYPTAFPYGNGMVLHFYQQQESSTTKTVHKVINKGLKTYV